MALPAPDPVSPTDVYTFFGVDSITLLVATLSAMTTILVRRYKKLSPITTRRKIVVDFLNGSTIYPFFLLFISPTNIYIFKYIETSRLSVALAGGVGIVFVVGELLLACSDEKSSKDEL